MFLFREAKTFITYHRAYCLWLKFIVTLLIRQAQPNQLMLVWYAKTLARLLHVKSSKLLLSLPIWHEGNRLEGCIGMICSMWFVD